MALSKSSTNTSPTSQPSIRFHILQGRNLAAKDLNGFSDPYVTVKINKLKVKTKCIKKTLNPDWYDILELTPDFETVPTVAQLVCWDKDTISKDFMGEIKINLLSLFDDAGIPKIFDDNPSTAQWIDLQKRVESDVISGQIRISYGFYIGQQSHYDVLKNYYNSLTITRSMESFSLGSGGSQLNSTSHHTINDLRSSSSGTSLAIDSKGLLYIDVISASDLPWDMNSTGTTFDMDPFVVVTLGETTFKTSTIMHNLNPEWNERLVFPLTPELHSFSVKFSVYDFDSFSHNDFIGSASVPITNILGVTKVDSGDPAQKRGTVFPLPLTLEPNFSKERFLSQLLIRAEYVPYKQVRKDFWTALATTYDADGNGNMNKVEIITMLESLDGGFQENVIEDFFQKFNKTSDSDELTFGELADCLEESTLADEGVLSISACPICHKKLEKQVEGHDNVSHIAICASKDPTKINRIVMGNFVTEANAQRKWFSKIASFVGYGEYKVGENNANILVQDRASGEILEEKMPTYIKLGIRLLYRVTKTTTENSRIKKILHTMSINQGKKYSDPTSVREIEPFINFHNLNRDEILDPLDSFNSFNEFFYRKLKPDARTLSSPDPRIAVSPADSRVMVFPTISNAQELWIKGEKFSISGLFNNEIHDDEIVPFEGGSLAIFRLAPQDYHRFHIPVDGVISSPVHVDGQYYTVNPMAIRSSLDVYGENKRCFSFIKSEHHGVVAMVCVGAMMVGSIVLTSTPSERVERLDEHGYFAFGGSTILVLFQKGTIQFDADLLRNSSKKLETLLRVGNSIGVSTL
ncbi:phosphatidylserine decarboxylase [Entomophthora muscae]|uniref:Phosphatidylserine decarboxylase n=1 Tax=Entomophthora muscae TaxID=34485 RepID=A0ACC2SQ44_9FUNG|nr:phosphatidylserine decarboxylase [Entomophthora muscae]